MLDINSCKIQIGYCKGAAFILLTKCMLIAVIPKHIMPPRGKINKYYNKHPLHKGMLQSISS